MRKAGPLALTAILYFTVSGGAFGVEELIGTAGPALAVALLIVVPLVWSIPMALMVAELSAALPFEGGYYRWVERAMGRFWGFQEAWWSWAASLPDMAIYPVLFAGYLGQAFELSPRGRWLAALFVIWSCTLLNLLGIRAVGVSAILAGAFLILPFVIFSVLGFADPAPATGPRVDWSFPVVGPGFLLALSIALWNYTGWDNISLVGQEVERPERSYPLALAAGSLLVIALYLLPVLAGLRVVPQQAAWTEGSFPTLARSLPGGAWLSNWLLLGALVSSWTLFNSQLLSYSRLPLVLAEDGYLPRRLARVGARGVPVAAVLISATLYSLFALLGFAKLIVVDVLLFTLSLVLEFIALCLLRRREPQLARPFRIPGGNLGLGFVVVPLLAVAAVVVAFTVWQGFQNPVWLALSLVGAVAGAPLYAVLRPRPGSRV